MTVSAHPGSRRLGRSHGCPQAHASCPCASGDARRRWKAPQAGVHVLPHGSRSQESYISGQMHTSSGSNGSCRGYSPHQARVARSSVPRSRRDSARRADFKVTDSASRAGMVIGAREPSSPATPSASKRTGGTRALSEGRGCPRLWPGPSEQLAQSWSRSQPPLQRSFRLRSYKMARKMVLLHHCPRWYAWQIIGMRRQNSGLHLRRGAKGG